MFLDFKMPRSNKKKKKDGSSYPSPIPGSSSCLEAPDDSLSSPTSVDIPSICLTRGPSLMVQRAIASGARHGIELIPGRVNPAIGNCAFEAPIFNLNDRHSNKQVWLG